MRLFSTLALAMLLSGCELLLTLQTCCYYKEMPSMCYCASGTPKP